jgi:putative Holliday junction resolvase
MARVLGVDPGSRRCGIAISDSRQSMAFPRPSIERDDQTLEHLRELVDEEAVERIVIGRPVSLAGNDTASTVDADAFFVQVREHISVPVIQFDERLTTKDAQKSLSEAGLTTKASRQRIDSAAAVIMLQNYIDGLNAE